jgi:hypothetical protein
MNAFPRAVSATAVSRGDGGGANYQIQTEEGMTLRDYFAAKAMQVFLENDRSSMKDDAKASYKMADEMMEARNVAQ